LDRHTIKQRKRKKAFVPTTTTKEADDTI